MRNITNARAAAGHSDLWGGGGVQLRLGRGDDDRLEALDARAIHVRHRQDVERRLITEHVVRVLVKVVLLPQQRPHFTSQPVLDRGGMGAREGNKGKTNLEETDEVPIHIVVKTLPLPTARQTSHQTPQTHGTRLCFSQNKSSQT